MNVTDLDGPDFYDTRAEQADMAADGCNFCGTLSAEHQHGCPMHDDAPYGPQVATEEEAFHAAEQARGDLAYCPDEVECYACAGFDGINFVMQAVVRLGPITGGSDPTQTFVLACGHTAM